VAKRAARKKAPRNLARARLRKARKRARERKSSVGRGMAISSGRFISRYLAQRIQNIPNDTT